MTLLTELPGFPATAGRPLKWTLDDLYARVVMIAQFNVGQYTRAETMHHAFLGVLSPEGEFDDGGDGMKRYLSEKERLATEACDAVMQYLRQVKSSETPL